MASERKTWIPLENNPDVMTPLAHELGLPKSLEFHDVYSVYDEDLLSFVPRPVYALLLAAPYNENHLKHSETQDAGKGEYTGYGDSEKVVWYKQTIGHACGTMGLIHCISNGPASSVLPPDSTMGKLLAAARPLKQDERSQLLYDSKELEAAHVRVSVTGQTIAPDPRDDPGNHYVGFVRSEVDGHLYELDGSRVGPIDLGPMDEDEDMLGDRVLDLTVRPYMKRQTELGSEIRFSLLALA